MTSLSIVNNKNNINNNEINLKKKNLGVIIEKEISNSNNIEKKIFEKRFNKISKKSEKINFDLNKIDINNYQNNYNNILYINDIQQNCSKLVKKFNNKNILKYKHKNFRNYTYTIDSQAVKNSLKKFLNSPSEKYKVDYFLSTSENPIIWKLIIYGPKKSLYEGWKFIFKLDFSKGFNKITDNINVQNEFYHLNFGEVGSPLLFDLDYNDKINFHDNFKNLFEFLYNLFKNPNCKLSENYNQKKKINEYKNNRDLYNNKVKKSILYMLNKEKF